MQYTKLTIVVVILYQSAYTYMIFYHVHVNYLKKKNLLNA